MEHPSESIQVQHDLFFTTIKEVHEFIHIHEGLQAYSLPGLSSRIEKLFKGCSVVTNEKWTNPARQTAFELILASSLVKKNIDIDLSTSADIRGTINNTTFLLNASICCQATKLRKI